MLATPERTLEGLFKQYMACIVDNHAPENTTEVYNRLLEAIADESAMPEAVIQIITQLFAQYPEHDLILLQLLRSISDINKWQGGYLYPEFRWLVVQLIATKDMDWFEQVYDVIPVLVDICGTELMRAFLLTMLVNPTHKTNMLTLLRAFYYTGHTIETLQMLHRLIKPSEQPAAFERLMLDTANFVLSRPDITFKETDRTFLIGRLKAGSPLVLANAERYEAALTLLTK